MYILKASQEEILELRQDASDLQEYSNAKIQRVTRYLGVLAEKAHKLGMIQFVLFSDNFNIIISHAMIMVKDDLLIP